MLLLVASVWLGQTPWKPWQKKAVSSVCCVFGIQLEPALGTNLGGQGVVSAKADTAAALGMKAPLLSASPKECGGYPGQASSLDRR